MIMSCAARGVSKVGQHWANTSSIPSLYTEHRKLCLNWCTDRLSYMTFELFGPQFKAEVWSVCLCRGNAPSDLVVRRRWRQPRTVLSFQVHQDSTTECCSWSRNRHTCMSLFPSASCLRLSVPQKLDDACLDRALVQEYRRHVIKLMQLWYYKTSRHKITNNRSLMFKILKKLRCDD